MCISNVVERSVLYNLYEYNKVMMCMLFSAKSMAVDEDLVQFII